METQQQQIQKEQSNIFRASEHQTIADQFCGALKLLPNNTVLAEGFSHNTGHAHTQFAEVYLVLRGSLKMALYHPNSREIEEVTLTALDAVRIPAGVGHKVIGGSSDNQVMVSCEPAFVPGDEIRSTELEDRYPRNYTEQLSTIGRSTETTPLAMYNLIAEFRKYLGSLADAQYGNGDHAFERSYLFSPQELIGKADELIQKLDRQLDGLDSARPVAELQGELAEFFKTTREQILSGAIILPSSQPDGVYPLANGARTKEQIIERMTRYLDDAWAPRIRGELPGSAIRFGR